ncbi:MAG: opacity protein [Cyclobacteriaceae bacterium]
MKTRATITMVLFFVLIMNASGQPFNERWSYELSLGPSVSIGDLSGADVNVGGGFEAIFHYQLMPHATAYVGWGWNHFKADQSFAGDDTDFEETGYVLGLQFKHPIGKSPLSYYARVGALHNHIELEDGGDIIGDTGHGLGWQLAGGLDIPVGKAWHLTPGVKFHTLSRTLDFNESKYDLDLKYLSLRVGITRKF